MATAVVPIGAAGATSRKPTPHCTDQSNRAYSTRGFLGLSGLYSAPRSRPTHLVAFAHGYRKPATVYWRKHLRETAVRGALAVAMDYRGIGPAPNYRGWNVRAGAKDTIVATKYLLRHCRSIKRVVLLGVSMGGNTSGLAVAARPKKPGGRGPLFDYWVNVEGATNVTETYLEASAAAPGVQYAAEAKADIEKEMGGTLAERPRQYRRETVIARVDDIAASGVRGVVVIHALEDGLVPYNQSRELATALRAHGVRTDFYTVLTRGGGESGTTLSGYVGTAIYNEYQSPFAGHAAEESETHVLMRAAFERLWALLNGATVGQREFIVDGKAGTIPS